ncbi:CRISPR system precrRNA processing endoribonuclease RAMP protein Cas6 [Actinopolyspora saharensis]|uniref:CRISPR-associated protein, Cas6 family n=1 Tax=Actinopolyspora saharensis TaxID=995062 RepID=A0A1H1A6W9_9ACTN|nr:CRISPR system precrRNA processing endoribonuclease RAMP protein Cas6 [Actinopolyspora saharensis]SDQ35455.1 CRISPR-associated protein, Cas6 family [Actinopolyspora saharensis]
MPATIRLTLDQPGSARIYPARLHGAACAVLESGGGEHRQQRKPFAVWPLRDLDGRTGWQLGWLAEHDPPAVPRRIRLGEAHCRVREVDVDGVSYARLANSEPARHAQLRMISPLYFSRNGRDHPLPDPVLIVRNAAQRWNAHAPEPLHVGEEQLRAITGMVFLHDLAGETVRTPVSATMEQTGFVGTVRLGLTRNAERVTRGLFAALMRFTAVAGVGAQTTHGFGGVQLEELDP